MSNRDLGLDLGTTKIIIYNSNMECLLYQPSIVAYDTSTDKVLALGDEAKTMVGKTPSRVRIVMPMADGVISDFDIAGLMLRGFLKQAIGNSIFKPRIVVCVPSGITGVELDAVASSLSSAGAKGVYLIEEPVAAALGIGIDISKPDGNMILDIGGGTSDIAVISLNGIVCKESIKIAGNKFDEDIVDYTKKKLNLEIGTRSAEQAKINIVNLDANSPENDGEYELKGRNTLNGIPRKQIITSKDIREALDPDLKEIVYAVKKVLERTPPELSADLRINGLYLTGGGAKIKGLDKYIEREIKIPVKAAENPEFCVAKGTAAAYKYIKVLGDGFVKRTADQMR